MKTPDYIICVPWEQRAAIPCVQRKCAMCECRVALDRGNVQATRKMVALCVECASAVFPGISPITGTTLVSGVAYHDPKGALLAANALLGRN